MITPSWRNEIWRIFIFHTHFIALVVFQIIFTMWWSIMLFFMLPLKSSNKNYLRNLNQLLIQWKSQMISTPFGNPSDITLFLSHLGSLDSRYGNISINSMTIMSKPSLLLKKCIIYINYGLMTRTQPKANLKEIAKGKFKLFLGEWKNIDAQPKLLI